MDWKHAAYPDPEFSRRWVDDFWPLKNWYDMPDHALFKLENVWPWDNLDASKLIASKLTKEQFLLWAVNNVTGQVCNGGFTQAFYNSYGELAEEAIAGLQLFGFARHAEIFDEAYQLFGARPIPRDRAERIERLAILAKIDRSSGEAVFSRELSSAIFRVTPDYWSGLEAEYFNLRQANTHGDGHDAAFYRPLAEWIFQRRDRFFVL